VVSEPVKLGSRVRTNSGEIGTVVAIDLEPDGVWIASVELPGTQSPPTPHVLAHLRRVNRTEW
jgi:hypothetical protein